MAGWDVFALPGLSIELRLCSPGSWKTFTRSQRYIVDTNPSQNLQIHPAKSACEWKPSIEKRKHKIPVVLLCLVLSNLTQVAYSLQLSYSADQEREEMAVDNQNSPTFFLKNILNPEIYSRVV